MLFQFCFSNEGISMGYIFPWWSYFDLVENLCFICSFHFKNKLFCFQSCYFYWNQELNHQVLLIIDIWNIKVLFLSSLSLLLEDFLSVSVVIWYVIDETTLLKPQWIDLISHKLKWHHYTTSDLWILIIKFDHCKNQKLFFFYFMESYRIFWIKMRDVEQIVLKN